MLFFFPMAGDVYNWSKHGRVDQQLLQESQDPATVPFLKRAVMVRPHNRRLGVKVWQPLLTMDYLKKRGVATVGSTFRQFIVNYFTWALEYKAQAFLRCLMVDMKIDCLAHTGPMLYKMLINTSCACFMDPTSENIVFFDTQILGLHYHFHKITLELDHEKETCLRATIVKDEDGRELLIEDCREIGTLVLLISASKTHPHIHWFANGIVELTPKWPLAHQSSQMVQALNCGAVFESPTMFDSTPENAAEVGTNNMVGEGLPHHGKIPSYIHKKSLFHQMIQKARCALAGDASLELSPYEIETILAATIMHSADHYYTDKFIGNDCRSSLLGKDYTLLRATMVAPNSYHTHNFLCRQHLDDRICELLYVAAKEVDAAFAENALFMSITA